MGTGTRTILDGAFLLLAALAASGAAWLFWHGLGQDAFLALALILIAVLSLENRHLRKRIQALETKA